MTTQLQQFCHPIHPTNMAPSAPALCHKFGVLQHGHISATLHHLEMSGSCLPSNAYRTWQDATWKIFWGKTWKNTTNILASR